MPIMMEIEWDVPITQAGSFGHETINATKLEKFGGGAWFYRESCSSMVCWLSISYILNNYMLIIIGIFS